MPRLELAMLVLDMKARGFDPLFPIILYENRILDGRNRYLSAQEAGVEPVFQDLPAGTDPEEFVQRANENRRHLDQEWLKRRRRERLERVVAARLQGQSVRGIAEQEGVSHVQVVRDLHEVTGTGVPVAPESGVVTGQDGRAYAYHAPLMPPSSAPTPRPAPVVMDALKQPVAVARLRPVFQGRSQIAELMKLLRQLQKKTETAVDSPAGGHLPGPELEALLRQFFDLLKRHQPHTVCGTCDGAGKITRDQRRQRCPGCGGLGFWDLERYRNADS